jgi:hypothetical protein
MAIDFPLFKCQEATWFRRSQDLKKPFHYDRPV